MIRRSLLAALLTLPLIGCVHSVKGSKMAIDIKRTPKCKVAVKMDSKLVFEGVAAKPCAKK
jgi:hypothetical protein